MKWLEAQQAKKDQEAQEQKAASLHENKMMPGPQNKHQSSKRHSPPTPPAPATSQPSVQDDARALAQSLGVDLSTVTGTGPDGQILPRDVRKATTVQKIDFPSAMGHEEPPASS